MNELIQIININLLELVGEAVQAFPAVIVALIVLLITRFSVRPIRQVVETTTGRLIHNASLQTLAIQMTTVGIWVTGILVACLIAFPGVDLGNLISLLGLGSVAIGFAFQDIFKNFLAGILLLLNEPFKLNDQIIVDQYEGTVESINIRSTAIRTYQGEQIVMPNSILFTSPVQVLTQYESRRTDLAIGLDYNTPLPRARHILQLAIADVEGVLSNPPPEVDITGFGDSSLNVVVRYWTKPQIVYVRQTRTRAILALKKACDDNRLNIPYPIRTLYFFDQDHYKDHHPTGNGATASEHQA